MKAIAEQFFHACEAGKGWEGCQAFCHPNVTFSSQTGALAGVDTLEAYTDWMKSIYTPMPNAS